MFLFPQIRKKSGKVYTYYSIAESHREGKKSQIQILWRMGQLTDQKASQIRQVLKIAQSEEGTTISLEDLIFSDHWRYLDVAVLDHVWKQWTLSAVLGSSRSKDGEVSTACVAECLVINRCLDPGSKLYASHWVRKTTLDRILGIDFDKFNDDKVYRELSKIEQHKPKIEEHLFRMIRKESPDSLSMVFYDLTSSHFEGTRCSLARPGLTKNEGFKSHKIVLSLIIDGNGIPFSWGVLEGDTADVTTIEAKVKDCRKRFGIGKVNLVFDRGMVSEANLALIEENGYQYISALDKDQIRAVPGLDLQVFAGETAEEIVGRIQHAGFQRYDDDLYFREIDAAERRYVIGFNPALFSDNRSLRQGKIDGLLAFVRQKNQALSEARKSVNESVLTRVVSEKLSGLRRFFRFRLEPTILKVGEPEGKSGEKVINTFNIVLEPRAENIEQARLLDGLCVLITNNRELTQIGQTGETLSVPDRYLYPADRVIQSYRDKHRVEQAFRNIKSFVDLNPMYVFTPEHVRAHYTICVLAYLLNVSITNQVKAAGTTPLKSSARIYEELSACILGEFRGSPSGKPVKRIKAPSALQRSILSALDCEHLVEPKNLRGLSAA